MATNPVTTMVGIRIPAQFQADTTKDTVTLDPSWIYDLHHNGVDAGGNADADEIMLGFDGVTAAAAAGAGLGTLTPGKKLTIHGVTTLEFLASANDPHFTIVPIGRTLEF